MKIEEAIETVKDGNYELKAVLTIVEGIREGTVTEVIRCPECKFYDVPLCQLYGRGDMTSRKGYCYHARRKDGQD